MPKRKIRGKVVSDKMDKTIVVAAQQTQKHPRYHKIISHTEKYKAHDEKNECGVGDMVWIEESRPFSKEKTWILKEVVSKAA